MGPLEEKIKSDCEAALRKGNSDELGTLRLLLSAMHNRCIEKKGKGEDETLTDAEVEEVLRKEVKKRREAAALYERCGRENLASRELEEAAVLERYLPPNMSEDELKNVVAAAFDRLNPAGVKDFGKMMGEVTRQCGGRADSTLIAKLVKEQLGA